MNLGFPHITRSYKMEFMQKTNRKENRKCSVAVEVQSLVSFVMCVTNYFAFSAEINISFVCNVDLDKCNCRTDICSARPYY